MIKAAVPWSSAAQYLFARLNRPSVNWPLPSPYRTSAVLHALTKGPIIILATVLSHGTMIIVSIPFALHL